MSRPRVYISGPITKGNRNEHFFRACELERALMLCGYAPLNPMRSIVLPFAWQDDMPHDLWLAVDLAWVDVCDAVVRLTGDSKGADEECTYAVERGIPVVYCGQLRGECFQQAMDRAVFELEKLRKEAA
jgi:hypothetical protein